MTKEMTAVPRVAVFDDLRVGQWVAWQPVVGTPVAGIVSKVSSDVLRFEDINRTDWHVGAEDIERGEVVVLRDVPEPPVLVRRADYDALRDAVTDLHPAYSHNLWHNVEAAARILIDNAEDTA